MPSHSDVLARLASRGLNLPEPPRAGGSYEPVRTVGGMIDVAIQFPLVRGVPVFTGRLGREVSTAEGVIAAEVCALNVLAQLDTLGFERLGGVRHIQAMMQTVDGWNDFPKVLDGASRLFLDVLGDVGRHSRSLFGVERLPMNVPIAIVVSGVVSPRAG